MLKTLDKLALFLATIGIGICSYLLYIKLSGSQIVCGLTSCGVVNSSEYANFLGSPVALWGLGFYLSVVILILLQKRALYFLITLIGVIFSAYLTYLEAFVIQAWCQWCILSAWLSLSLFIIAIIYKRRA